MQFPISNLNLTERSEGYLESDWIGYGNFKVQTAKSSVQNARTTSEDASLPFFRFAIYILNLPQPGESYVEAQGFDVLLGSN